MTRVKVKGTQIRARSNPEAEPDFWRGMRWVGTSQAPGNCYEFADSLNKSPRPRGSVSVVSQDTDFSEADMETDVAKDVNSFPIGHHLTRSPPASPLKTPETKQQESNVRMSGWGRPFYYLGAEQVGELVPDKPVASASSISSNSALLPPTKPMGDQEFLSSLKDFLGDGSLSFASNNLTESSPDTCRSMFQKD